MSDQPARQQDEDVAIGFARPQQGRAFGQKHDFAVGERLGQLALACVAEQGNPLDGPAAPVAAPPVGPVPAVAAFSLACRRFDRTKSNSFPGSTGFDR